MSTPSQQSWPILVTVSRSSRPFCYSSLHSIESGEPSLMELVGATQTCGSFWGRSITNTFRSGTKQTFKMHSLVGDFLLVMNCTIIFFENVLFWKEFLSKDMTKYFRATISYVDKLGGRKILSQRPTKDTVKTRFWNTTWSAAKVCQNRVLFQNNIRISDNYSVVNLESTYIF